MVGVWLSYSIVTVHKGNKWVTIVTHIIPPPPSPPTLDQPLI